MRSEKNVKCNIFVYFDMPSVARFIKQLFTAKIIDYTL